MEFEQLFDFIGTVTHNRYTGSLVVILIAFVVQRIGAKVIGRIVRRAVKSHKYATLLEERKRENTISRIFTTIAGVVIWLVAVVAIAKIFDIDLTAIAASLGLLSVVIGLGAQTTIRDYVAGIYILAENQYRVGDVVTLSGGTTGALGTSGVVEDITLRITKLRDLDGTLNIVRNGEASIVTNRTYEYSSVVIDVTVAYDSSIDKVERIMNEVGDDLTRNESVAQLISEPIKFLRVDKFTDSGVTVRALGKVLPAEQWTVAGEYRRQLLKAFKQADIEIPLPQIVVHSIDKKTVKK